MIHHEGFSLSCDGSGCDQRFESTAHTERTAVVHAREARWFVGNIRITAGVPRRSVRTVKRVLCPLCTWLVGQ
ncbi:MAG: hypothetical protein AB7O24_04425 [Kofleriaceae bacterium]